MGGLNGLNEMESGGGQEQKDVYSNGTFVWLLFIITNEGLGTIALHTSIVACRSMMTFGYCSFYNIASTCSTRSFLNHILTFWDRCAAILDPTGVGVLISIHAPM